MSNKVNSLLAHFLDYAHHEPLERSTGNLKYSQTYTNVPENSRLGFLENSLLKKDANNTMANDFTYEVFSVGL